MFHENRMGHIRGSGKRKIIISYVQRGIENA
jgi:hypothetical protein